MVEVAGKLLKSWVLGGSCSVVGVVKLLFCWCC